MVMLGYAYQKGLVPLERASIERAIELNGAEIGDNRLAFDWGRRAAHQAEAVAEALAPFRAPAPQTDLDALIEQRAAFLCDYQDGAYARRYRDFVARVRAAEARLGLPGKRLTHAVASAYFRLLAIKDEYEVARLYSDGVFLEALKREFGGDYRIHYHLAPPLTAARDPLTGRPKKRAYGPWMGKVFSVLTRLRRLRGTRLDPFGYTGERKMERRLILEYEQTIGGVLEALHQGNLEIALEIAALPAQMRGYGRVKAKNVAAAKNREQALLAAFHGKRAVAA